MQYYYNLALYFADISAKYANQPAIKYLDKSYSYQQLNNKSDLLVNFLIKHGVAQGDVIAIVNTKEIGSFSLMLACLKLGAAYVNLDSECKVAFLSGYEKAFSIVISSCFPL